VTEDVLRGLERILTEWKDQHEPIREAWEVEQKRIQAYKEKKEAIIRFLVETKAYLRTWRGKDPKGSLWSGRVKPIIAKIGLVLDPKTQRKYLNATFLKEIRSDIEALQVEVKIQKEDRKVKKAGLVNIPQLPFDLDSGEESETFIGADIDQIGQPVKTTKTVPYWKYLLIQLDRKLTGKGKVKTEREPVDLRGMSGGQLLNEFDYERQEGGQGKGYMGRDINNL